VSRYERMAATLTAAFQPEILEIEDESGKHAGHAARNGLTPNAETHFHVTMVAAAFAGQSRVACSRAVNEALAEEFESGLHALGLTLRAPQPKS
jgi:stress-induced morphogen